MKLYMLLQKQNQWFKSQWGRINTITHLEAIAISVQLNETKSNLCNIYLSNQTKIYPLDIGNISKQIQKPFIILGDFNAHCPIWRSEKTNCRGKIIEKNN